MASLPTSAVAPILEISLPQTASQARPWFPVDFEDLYAAGVAVGFLLGLFFLWSLDTWDARACGSSDRRTKRRAYAEEDGLGELTALVIKRLRLRDFAPLLVTPGDPDIVRWQNTSLLCSWRRDGQWRWDDTGTHASFPGPGRYCIQCKFVSLFPHQAGLSSDNLDKLDKHSATVAVIGRGPVDVTRVRVVYVSGGRETPDPVRYDRVEPPPGSFELGQRYGDFRYAQDWLLSAEALVVGSGGTAAVCIQFGTVSLPDLQGKPLPAPVSLRIHRMHG